MPKNDRGDGNSVLDQKGQEQRESKLWAWGIYVIALVLAAIALVLLFVRCEGEQPAAVLPTTAPTRALALPTRTQAAVPATVPAVTPRSVGLADVGSLPVGTPPPQVYAVQRGDTLSEIARRFGCDLETLIKDNGIDNANVLQVGTKLRLSTCQIETGPASVLLPNSEFVNGPAYVDFDIAAFVERKGGYLGKYQEYVGGEQMTGPEIVALIAHRYSVGPRMLLAVLELKSGWVTDPDPNDEALSYPMGYKGGGWDRLYWQLAWAADELNKGYYDWRGRGMSPIVWRDGTVSQYDPALNAATAGLQYFFSLNVNKNRWERLVGTDEKSFAATYRRLFGDTDRYAIEPLISADVTQPPLSLPWAEGDLWYYTSGPHGGWEEGSAWSALDFAPNERGLGCRVASSYASAAAPGLVVYSKDGEVVIDLDRDGHEETGWVLFYLHLAKKDRVPAGTRVKLGDPLGHPSCEGGMSEATHLHIARRYNGEWIAVDGPLPFVLSGWQFHSSGESYDGTATRGGEERTACECWKPDFNGLVADR